MKSFRSLSKRRYFRNAIVYLLIYCLVLNTSVPIVLAVDPPAPNTLPSGGSVAPGYGSVGEFDYSTANQLHIRDVAERTVIDWDSFDIGSEALTKFYQLGDNPAVLNRIAGGDMSQIFGTLEANGAVYIVNSAGVYFGAGASVNVNQLVASSLDITNDNFQNGIYEFVAGEGSVGGITNDGTISAAEGVALLGKYVRNNGSITTTNEGGFVVMAAGDRVLLGESGSNVLVEMNSVTTDNEGDGEVVNNGNVTSPAGTVVLAAGDVFSSALELPKVSNGSGKVEQNGHIYANGTTGDGGNISLTAADEVVLASGSETFANAGTTGDAGLVVVHSQDRTDIEAGAQIQAKGGHVPHDIYGAFDDVVETTVEVSGDNVNLAGSIDASATGGKRGKIVIDALDMTVANGSKPVAPADNTVYEKWIEAQSNAATDVELLAHSRDAGNITVENISDGEITGGSGDIVLRTKYDTGGIAFLGDPATIHTTKGGNVYMLAGEDGITAGDIITDVPSSDKVTEPGKIRLLTTNNGDISTGRLSVQGGSYDEISVIANGNLTVNGSVLTTTNQVPSDTQEVGQARTCLVSDHGNVVVNGAVAVEAHGKYRTTADIHIDAGQNVTVNLGGGQIKATAKTSQSGPANATVLIHAGKDIEGPGVVSINNGSSSGAIFVDVKAGGGSDSVTLTANGQSNIDLEQTVGNAHGKIEVDNNRTAECPECPTPPGLVPPLDPWAYTTHMGDAISGNVLQNESLEIINHTDPSHGTLIIDDNGDYQYTPNPGFVGQDRFTYQAKVTDTGVETDWVEVTIDVINALPVANPGSSIDHMGVLITNGPLNAYDVSDGLATDDIIVNIVEQPLHGTVTVQKVGDTWTYTYTPETNENGEYYVGIDSFTYSVTDAQGVVGPGGTSTVTITLTNTPPVQNDDTASTNQGLPITIDVLANDSDPDGPDYTDPLTVVQDSVTVQHGTLILNEDGTFTYTPDPGYVGYDTFTYAVKDGQQDQSLTWTTVVIWVNAALLIPAAPLPAEVEYEVSGCPALIEWTANEVGVEKQMVQIWMANALASPRDIQPCDACANLNEMATNVLQDPKGTYKAAMVEVLNEYASSEAPPSEEQMALINTAIVNNTQDDNALARTQQYLDSIVAYVNIVGELGLTKEQAITVATDKYVSPLAEGGNTGLATFVAARLTALGQ
jgi:filamentous hemagglutinin family protein